MVILARDQEKAWAGLHEKVGALRHEVHVVVGAQAAHRALQVVPLLLLEPEIGGLIEGCGAERQT